MDVRSKDSNWNSQELEFAIFCIESVAERMGVDAERVFQALDERSDVLRRYIVANYDVLHTQGKDYIVDDILSVMREKGVAV